MPSTTTARYPFDLSLLAYVARHTHSTSVVHVFLDLRVVGFRNGATLLIKKEKKPKRWVVQGFSLFRVIEHNTDTIWPLTRQCAAVKKPGCQVHALTAVRLTDSASPPPISRAANNSTALSSRMVAVKLASGAFLRKFDRSSLNSGTLNKSSPTWANHTHTHVTRMEANNGFNRCARMHHLESHSAGRNFVSGNQFIGWDDHDERTRWNILASEQRWHTFIFCYHAKIVQILHQPRNTPIEVTAILWSGKPHSPYFRVVLCYQFSGWPQEMTSVLALHVRLAPVMWVELATAV
jgi:hypothetical protein